MESVVWVTLAGVIVAAIGLGAAYKQLGNLSRQLQLTEKSDRASVLMELDKKWDDIFESRKALRDLAEGITDEVKEQISEEAFLGAITNRLNKLKAEESKDYFLLKKVFDFCETVGFFMDRQYVDPCDVKDLWGPAIKSWSNWSRAHIICRQGSEGNETYKYFLLAAEKCQD